MNGCNMAFNTLDALQKHVVRHFHSSPPPRPKVVQSHPIKTVTPPPMPSPPRVCEHNEEVSSDIGSAISRPVASKFEMVRLNRLGYTKASFREAETLLWMHMVGLSWECVYAYVCFRCRSHLSHAVGHAHSHF